jgi:hypothetical protein
MKPGDLVLLLDVPSGLTAGLPKEDQVAIHEAVGRPVTFAGMTYGQAELEFKDNQGDEHTIWVDTNLIRPI